MEEGEEGAERAAEEDDVVAVVDWSCKGVFVRVEDVEDVAEEGDAAVGLVGFEVAVVFEEFGEEREDECEGYLVGGVSTWSG